MTTAFRTTPEADRPHRSRECKRADCDQCDGFYDTSGSAFGYDTYRCHCGCHNPSNIETRRLETP